MRVSKPGSAKGIHGSAEAAARILSSCPPLQLWPCWPGRPGASGTTVVKSPVRCDSKAEAWVWGCCG